MSPEWTKPPSGVGMKTENQNQNGLGSVNDAQQNFVELIEANRQKLYGMIYNMVRNHQDTEDLLQDTYSKASKGFHSFKGDSSFSTWISKIAYNTTINFIRKRKNIYKVSIDDTDNNLEQDSVFLDKTTAIGVDKQYIKNETIVIVRGAISKLSANHRDVVRLFDLEGWSHKQIADSIGVNECTVRSRLFYAHKKLEVLLAEYKEVL
jgi:RNA polymerase sigma-70 factor (ECF subfamily)